MSANIHTRYQVGAESVGLIDAVSRKDDALRLAWQWAREHGEDVNVLDTMSRLGADAAWRVPAGGAQ